MIFTLRQPLQNIFSLKNNSLLRFLALTFTGAGVLAFASQLSIPFQPVPLTFQSATVVFLGLLFGSRLSAAMVATYLTLGLCGLPVFADASMGLVTLMGPTGGYLAGFLPAAALTGWLAERGFAKNSFSAFAAALIGASVIFFCGYTWLAQFIGWNQAYLLGVKLFVVTECVKLFFAALVAPHCWRKSH